MHRRDNYRQVQTAKVADREIGDAAQGSLANKEPMGDLDAHRPVGLPALPSDDFDARMTRIRPGWAHRSEGYRAAVRKAIQDAPVPNANEAHRLAALLRDTPLWSVII